MLKRVVIKRIEILFMCCCLFLGTILSKLAYEQLYHQSDTMNKANNLWQRDFVVSGNRGAILDRNQKILAHDLPSTSLVVVSSQIEDKKNCAKLLAPILKCDEQALLNTISKKASTTKLQKEGKLLSVKQVAQIEALNLKGVYLIQDTLRNYPNGAYLAQVLGFCGIDNQGLAGLELQYDHILKGKNGSLKIPFDAKGNQVDLYHEKWVEAGYGMNVILTIDSKIQQVLEKELNQAMITYQCLSAYALALDPNTGEILGMVSKPDFDPNHYQDYSSEIYNQNLGIFKSFEPGSTFKSIIFASALEANLFDMFHDYYDDKGYEMVNGVRIKSWKAGGHGRQSFLQVLENSSNPGFVEISRRMGLDLLYESIKRFGFLEKTNVDLPGEAKGIMFKKEDMSELEQATVAFGQGISVTAIQLVSAFASLINGGKLYQPYITKQIENPYTKEIIQENKPIMKRETISKKTSDQMRYALESVVANGGGKAAYIQGYRIGGKTGTAQKVVDGTYSKTDYILSFLSFAPVEDPKIVLYIALDSPKNDILYGGTLVAPIAKSVYEEVLPYMNVEKSKEQLPLKKVWPQTQYVVVDDFVGKKKKDVQQENVKFTFIGEGDVVLQQMPQANTMLNQEYGEVWIYLGKDEFE